MCGFRHELIPTFEFDNPDYVKNDKDRCFHCKDELFNRLEQIAAERGVANIVYGVNTDDLGDYRPGQTAAKIHQVKAPLVEAGLSKSEIRELARTAGLPFWDRPAARVVGIVDVDDPRIGRQRAQHGIHRVGVILSRRH